MGRHRPLSLRSRLSKAWAAALAAGVWWGADAAWALGQTGARIWLPEGVSSVAPAIDRLFYIVLWITGIVFVAVQATLLAFLIRYRQRPGRRAAYTHGNLLAEIIWTVIPALILVWLAFYNQRIWAQVRGTPPSADLEIAAFNAITNPIKTLAVVEGVTHMSLYSNKDHLAKVGRIQSAWLKGLLAG